MKADSARREKWSENLAVSNFLRAYTVAVALYISVE
jgi:hypothetical protein